MKNMKNMIRELQTKVASMPVNHLGALSVDEVCNMLNVYDKGDVIALIDTLNKECVLQYKYKFICDCGERNIAYQHKLDHEKYVCPICGKEYDEKEIKTNSEILIDVDKEAIMSLESLNETLSDRSSENSKIITIKNDNNTKSQEKGDMEIFIGSSSEQKEYMDEIATQLEELNCKPLKWNSTGKGIFPPGETTIDALNAIAKRVEAAIFIFSEDDKIWNEKSGLGETATVRDNVLFEYGLFMGAKGKNNVCIVQKGKTKSISDLQGITYIDAEKGEMHTRNKLKDWLGNIK